MVRRVCCAAVCLLFVAGVAQAEILSTTGSCAFGPAPADVTVGALESNTTITCFNEVQDFTLGGGVAVDITAAGTYMSFASLTPGSVPFATPIDSHFIHFDQIGPGATTLSGSVTFSGKILGVIVRTGTLSVSDFLGAGGTLYPTGVARRGVDWDAAVPEVITVSPDLFTLNVTLHTSNVIDQVRVITEAEPTNGTTDPKPRVWEFSLDIGSDIEMSDPNADGDEGADPGDVYLSNSGPITPPVEPCGRDGFKDDAFIFGGDPPPFAPDCGGGSGAPVGSGCPPQDCYESFFDLDAHDQTDIDLTQWINPDMPLNQPIPQSFLGVSNCIYKPEFLMYSYDDDRAAGWPSGDVPVTGSSPAGVSSYGTTAGEDEINGLTLVPAGLPPYAVSSSYSIEDERRVHPSLVPNPDTDEEDDDDVDSLDILPEFTPGDPGGPPTSNPCPFWYFSADHEAHAGLDFGSVYLATGGGAPLQIIDDVVHLGLLESTDINAFEFTWIEEPIEGVLSLAILFSVDDDDPLTPVDESGGLMPRMIYASFMTGFSFPVLMDPLDDDIDALTIWCEDLEDDSCDCLGDMDGSGVLDGNDIQSFTDCLTGVAPATVNCDCADMDGNGTLDMTDVALFVQALLNKTPC